MSNALAIAAVTAVLRDLLQDGIVDHDAANALGDVTVSVLPPDRVLEGLAADASQINLFLYQVSPNQGWRNVGLPTLSGGGQPMGAPPLALDLHYLLTVYSNQDYHAELLLGYAMQLLHETPVLTRDAIREALRPPSPVSGGGVLPAPQGALAAADLAEQVELVKLTPEHHSLEELSHLWSNLQSRYRPSVSYLASVVLIESRRPARSAPPVQRPLVYAIPLRRPTIEQVASQSAASAPLSTTQPILPGYRLGLIGHSLGAARVRVRVGPELVTPAAADIGTTLVTVALPATLRAGVQAAQVLHELELGEPAVAHRGVESNVAAFVLRPTLSAAPSFVAGPPPGAELSFVPPVGKAQRLVLLLDELQAEAPELPPARSYSLQVPARQQTSPADPDEDSTLTIAIPGVAPGRYLVRVQVDGAESPLTMSGGRYSGPTLTVPA